MMEFIMLGVRFVRKERVWVKRNAYSIILKVIAFIVGTAIKAGMPMNGLLMLRAVAKKI
jgi:hypothetical protein